MRIRREIAGALVHIDPEDAGKEILVDELAIQPEVVWILLITGGVIQIAIGTEVEVAAVVIGSLIKLLQQDEFGIGICDSLMRDPITTAARCADDRRHRRCGQCKPRRNSRWWRS